MNDSGVLPPHALLWLASVICSTAAMPPPAAARWGNYRGMTAFENGQEKAI